MSSETSKINFLKERKHLLRPILLIMVVAMLHLAQTRPEDSDNLPSHLNETEKCIEDKEFVECQYPEVSFGQKADGSLQLLVDGQPAVVQKQWNFVSERNRGLAISREAVLVEYQQRSFVIMYDQNNPADFWIFPGVRNPGEVTVGQYSGLFGFEDTTKYEVAIMEAADDTYLSIFNPETRETIYTLANVAPTPNDYYH